MFQSLTGSIHTSVKVLTLRALMNVSIPHRFNSHINWSAEVIKPIEFQSLTGSIHTKKVEVKDGNQNQVSIPHRFNSHKTKVKL